VPYGDLVGHDAEGELRDRLMTLGRVGVVGPVGCGKSSLVRYVVDVPPFAPVLVNVATEDPKHVAEPRAFLEVLIAQLARSAARASALSEEDRVELLRAARPTETLAGREKGIGGELGVSAWMLDAKVSGDLTKTLPPGEVYTTTDELRDVAGAALRAVAGHGLVPVLVADDTDRLLRLPDQKRSRELFVGFFGEVLRMIVDTLEAGLVVAVHDRYRTEAEHRYDALVEGRIEHHLAVPELTDPSHLGKVITARAEFLDAAATCADLLDDDGLRELLRLHTSDHERSLRRTLVVLKGAFSLASDDGVECAGVSHVQAAQAG
jgi:hypothetical protein